MKTGQRVKDEELEYIMNLLDVDGSGEVDDDEFKAWYGDDSDIWLSKRRTNPNDPHKDTALLKRESMRFDVEIMEIIDEFWSLVDVDGNGEIDENEYIDLSLHLQQSMADYEAAEKKGRRGSGQPQGESDAYFDEQEAYQVAKKEVRSGEDRSGELRRRNIPSALLTPQSFLAPRFASLSRRSGRWIVRGWTISTTTGSNSVFFRSPTPGRRITRSRATWRCSRICWPGRP